MSPENARRSARLRFGNPQTIKEQAHAADVMQKLDDLGRDLSRDLRYALRQMQKSPGQTAIMVITLAIGIGANSAAFSFAVSVAASATEPPQVRQAMMVSDNVFQTLGIMPLLGQALTSENATPGREPVAVVGDNYWVSELRADRGVIGRTLRLNGIQFAIVGVAPQSFSGIDRFFPPALYVPFAVWGRLENT